MELWWKYTWRERPTNGDTPCPSVTLSTTKPTKLAWDQNQAAALIATTDITKSCTLPFSDKIYHLCLVILHNTNNKRTAYMIFLRSWRELRPTCFITLPRQLETICAYSQPSVTQICVYACIYLEFSSISICPNERTDTTSKKTEFTELSRPRLGHVAK